MRVKICLLPKFCWYRVHDARQMDLEIPVELALMQPLQISSLDTSRVNDDLTVVSDDQKGSGRQLLFGNCTLNVKSIPICDGGCSQLHLPRIAM
jgi:hypothetical protein